MREWHKIFNKKSRRHTRVSVFSSNKNLEEKKKSCNFFSKIHQNFSLGRFLYIYISSVYSIIVLYAWALVARSRGSASELSGRTAERGKEKAKESSRYTLEGVVLEVRRGEGERLLPTTSYTYEIIYYLERGVIWCGHWIAKVAVKSWRRKEDGRKVDRRRRRETVRQIER